MIPAGTPYHQGDAARLRYAPFAGRQDALVRAAALLSEIGRPNGLLFLGAPGMGKSALLHAVAAALPDAFVAATLSLDSPRATPSPVYLDETTLLVALAEAITAALVDRAYTLSRLEQIDPPGDDPRGWFELVFLPPIFGALRAERPLVWLIDDADVLIASIRAGRLPEDFPGWLSGLMVRARVVNLIMTADDAIDSDLHLFAPLIGLNDVSRLAPLLPDDVRWLLSAPIDGMFELDEGAHAVAYRLTGGVPLLAQRLGGLLVARWQVAPEITRLNARDVLATQPTLYLQAEELILEAWDRLTANERIVLTALSGLHYDDPLRRASAEAIERWLTDGDHPLDLTTVGTALRALEYRHWLTRAADGAALRSDIHLQWLLAHAAARTRLRESGGAISGERPRRFSQERRAGRDGRGRPDGASDEPRFRRMLRWLVVIFVVVLIANAIVFLTTQGGASPAITTPTAAPPTATLLPPAPVG